MDELKLISASNIIKLRTGAGMTQAELGEKLNYSDKSISKWERGDAIPDAFVLLQMSRIFGVTVDYLLTEHDDWAGDEKAREKDVPQYSSKVVAWVAVIGIWTLALLVFVIFWIFGSLYWLIFACAVPVTLITLLVFNSVWRKGKSNDCLVAALVLSLFLLVYLVFLPFNNIWQMFLLLAPAELIVFLSFRIRKRKN